MNMTFPIALDVLEPRRLDTPKRSEITMYLVIFIWELDVVLCDICPPVSATLHVSLGVYRLNLDGGKDV